MRRFLLASAVIIMFCLSAGSSQGSSWSFVSGGSGDDRLNAVHQTADGGYIAAGYTASAGAGSNDALVVRLNADGTTAWQYTYGSSGDDGANAVRQTADGGYIVAGYMTTAGGNGIDAWVFKLNALGAVVWQKTYGGTGSEKAYSIEQTDDGGYIVSGATTALGTGGGIDAWIWKLDADGNVGPAYSGTWQKTFGGTLSDYAKAVRQTADGGYVIAGYSTGAGSGTIWVLKLDASGSVLWKKTYDSATATDIRQTADGGYIMTGYGATALFGMSYVWVYKLNTDGSVGWVNRYGGVSDDYAYSVGQTADGGYIVAGNTNSYGDGLTANAWLLRLTTDGAIAWQKSYGGTAFDTANSIQQTVDGGYVMAGYTTSLGSGNSDAWLLKLDSLGNLPGCSTILIAGSGAAPIPQAVTPLDASQTVSSTSVVPADTTVSNAPSGATVTLSCFNNIEFWEKTYGSTFNDGANVVRQLPGGGYLAAGYYQYSAPFTGDWIFSLDALGNLTGQTSFAASNGTSHVNALSLTLDGGYITAGYTTTGTAGKGDEARVIKYSGNGSIAWRNTFGRSHDDHANDIQQTADGGYIVAGDMTPAGSNYSDGTVHKLNSDGSIAWERTFSASQWGAFVSAIRETPDHRYILAGYRFPVYWYSDAWVMKLDQGGTPVWEKTYGGAEIDRASSIELTTDGGYILAGYTRSFGQGGADAWVLKLNSAGTIEWEKTYGTAAVDEVATSIQQTADGGYIFTGYSGGDALVVKLTSNGALSWQKAYGGTGSDSASSIQQTPDGGYIVAGTTNSSGAGNTDAWILKLDQHGDIPGCSSVKSAALVEQTSAAIVSTTASTLKALSSTESLVTGGTATATAIIPGAQCSAAAADFMLDLVFSGTGTGRVTSLPAGLDCTADCRYAFPSGGLVTLMAAPDTTGMPVVWSGACSQPGPVNGQVTMSSDRSCTVTFDTIADFTGSPLYGGHGPLQVDFSGQSGNSPTSFAWDFGDNGTGTGSNTSHVYRLPGLYTVTMTAAGTGGAATARKVDYVTVAPCDSKPARIAGPWYYTTVADAYLNAAGGSIDLQATEFVEDVTLALGKTVTLTGGWPCGYGPRIGDTLIRGSLTFGGTDVVTLDGIVIE